MYSRLISHIQKFIPVTEAETALIASAFESRKIKKKELLLSEGQICNIQYFVVRGCLRTYIINEKGSEQTTQFAIENWWITDYLSLHNNTPSLFYIQAIEDTEILSIETAAFEALLKKVPQLERYFRLVMQKAFGASQVRIRYLFTMSAEERFHHMNSMFPEFVQRVPQYMLASYLDFSPEFMSRIRAGIARK